MQMFLSYYFALPAANKYVTREEDCKKTQNNLQFFI